MVLRCRFSSRAILTIECRRARIAAIENLSSVLSCWYSTNRKCRTYFLNPRSRTSRYSQRRQAAVADLGRSAKIEMPMKYNRIGLLLFVFTLNMHAEGKPIELPKFVVSARRDEKIFNLSWVCKGPIQLTKVARAWLKDIPSGGCMATAGVEEGDEVLQVDGVDITAMSGRQLGRMFDRPNLEGSSQEFLIMKKGGKQMIVTVRYLRKSEIEKQKTDASRAEEKSAAHKSQKQEEPNQAPEPTAPSGRGSP